MKFGSATTTLRWLFLIQLLSMGSMEMSAPFWAQRLQQLSTMSSTAIAWVIGMAYAGPMLTTMLFSPLWGRVGDRTGHKLMMVRALLALTFTQFWIAYSDDIISNLAARLLQGAIAGFIVASQAYGCTLVERTQRGKLMAGLQMATALGSVLGPMIGGYIYGGFGFNQINLIAAIVCACSTVMSMIFLPSIPPVTERGVEDANRVGSLNKALLSPIAAILLAIVLVQSAKVIPQLFFAVYAEKVLHAPAWLIGTSYGATAFGLCLAAPFWARHFATLPRPQILREVEYCCWFCAGLLGLQGLIDNLSLFIIGRIIWGIFLAALLPVFYSLLSRDVSDSQQGWALGWGNSAAKAGALVGIVIGSVSIASISIENLFWPVCVIYLVCAFVVRHQRLDNPDLSSEIRSADSFAP